MAISKLTKTEKNFESKLKVMLIAFFDSEGLIPTEFVPPEKTVSEQFYAEVLIRLRQRFRKVRPHLQQNGSWMFYLTTIGLTLHSL